MKRLASVRLLLVLLTIQACLMALASPVLADDPEGEGPNSPINPPHLCCMGFDYMPNITRIVMFGGLDNVGTGNVSQTTFTWHYTPTIGWRVKLGTAPTDMGPLSSTRIVYFPGLYTSGRIVLFGGTNAKGNPPVDNDTWTFTGTSWIRCTTCTTSPFFEKRTSPGLAYDPTSGAEPPAVVMFGGSNDGTGEPFGAPTGSLGDTWTLGGNLSSPDWTECTSDVSSFCPEAPLARGTPGMAYYPPTARTVLFGGGDGETKYGDTWYYDHSNTSDRWDRCTDTNSNCDPPNSDSCAPSTTRPCSRYGHRMALYDTATDEIVMFGAGEPSVLNDTWLWKNSAPPTWVRCDSTNGCTTTPPAIRCCVGLAFFPGTYNRIVLFGGGYEPIPSARGDTWTWDLTNSWVCWSTSCDT
jgi:hypothetical protein